MLRRILGAGPPAEARAIDASDFGLALDYDGGAVAGVAVTEDNALQLSAFYAGVRILSEGVAALPVDTFQRVNGDRVPFRPRPAWLDSPSPFLTWHEFVGQLMFSVLVHGNAYALVKRDASYRIIGFEVVDPASVAEVVADRTGYAVLFEDGTRVGATGVLHVPGLMRPGRLDGLSILSAARESLGLGIAAQRYGSTFFEGGGTPRVVVSTPDKLSPAGVKATKRAWREALAEDADSVAVLSEGASFQQVSVPPDDAQFLQTRAFQVADIARFFGVPPHLLADASGSTSWGSGLAEQSTNYVTHSLRPWVSRLEGRLTRLMAIPVEGERDASRAFVRLNVSGLLRGDYETRWATHRANVQAGLMTANEVRKIEDIRPIEGGDDLLRPLNLMPADDPDPSEATDNDE